MSRPLIVSAPGSLMLLGEHAVLQGHPCLVAAIDRRVRVSIIPRNDGIVAITSALGDYEGDRDALPDHPAFRFVIGALRQFPDGLPGGLDAVIQADMPPTIGFGTSAAVTVAFCGALYTVGHGSLDPAIILRESRAVIRTVQGRGSGADAAASTYGGVVFYRQTDAIAEVISREPHPLTALYCGYKTPTPEVIARVDVLWQARSEERERLYAAMGATADAGRAAIDDPARFGSILNEGHRLMQELGVSTPELEACVARLRDTPGITGAKISGSGFGDCAVGWGSDRRAGPARDADYPKDSTSPQPFAMLVSPEGMRLE